ncbi:MAG: diguanylate cyclase [Desulfovibrionaceae bacterium]|nr:diguanylate cyclase [Desulfovibrionaceae bacterium]
MNTLKTIELGAIFNSIPNPIFIKDENLQFVFVNKAYEKMFNTKMKYILGKTVLDLEYLAEEHRIFYQNEDMELMRSGKTKHHVFDYLYKEKEMHTCLYWSSGFVQKDGDRGLIGVIVDINKQSKKIHALRKRMRIIDSEKKEIAKKNKIDALTRLYTRGTFDEALQKLASSSGGFSCILLDVDHFKRVNDTFGHAAGDAVLRAFAAIVQKCSRKRDMACRYGGEEFVVLLPGSKLDVAIMAAERIRRGVLKHVHTPDGKRVTTSAGCSEYIPGESAAFAVQRADKALYMAKQSGRNRICVV